MDLHILALMGQQVQHERESRVQRWLRYLFGGPGPSIYDYDEALRRHYEPQIRALMERRCPR